MKAALKGHQLASRGYASQLGATAEAVERTVEPRRCLASRPCHALFYMMASSRESRLGGYARALDDVPARVAMGGVLPCARQEVDISAWGELVLGNCNPSLGE